MSVFLFFLSFVLQRVARSARNLRGPCTCLSLLFAITLFPYHVSPFTDCGICFVDDACGIWHVDDDRCVWYVDDD